MMLNRTTINRGVDFVPTDITELKLWLDASDLTTITESSGNVSQWDDKSGEGNHLSQATSTNQPGTGNNTKNGLNVLDHDGTEYLARATFVNGALTQPNTIFCVCKVPLSNANYVLDGGGVSTRHAIFTSSGNYGIYAGAVLNSSATETGGNWVLLTLLADTTTSELWENQTSLATGDIGTQNLNGLVVYGRYTGTGLSTGDVAEVIIYNKELTSGEISDVETYLSDKWDV
jgi:hypothetical protein